MHLHGCDILLCSDSEAILLNCIVQPRKRMVDYIYLHPLNKPDQCVFIDDGRNEAVFIHQHPLYSHPIQWIHTEQIQIITLPVSNLETKRRSPTSAYCAALVLLEDASGVQVCLTQLYPFVTFCIFFVDIQSSAHKIQIARRQINDFIPSNFTETSDTAIKVKGSKPPLN